MTQLRDVNARQACDALLFFARLEYRQLQGDVERIRSHAEDFRTIVLGCQAIYHTLMLLPHIPVLSPIGVRGYAESPAYDSDVEFFVDDFGQRLRAVREAKGYKPKMLAEKAYPGDTAAAADARTSFTNYLSRIEKKNVPVGMEYQQLLAKLLGFPSISAFWIAIETAAPGDHTSGLISASSFPDNSPLVDSSKVDADAVALPTSADLERVVIGAAQTITHAIDRLGERLASREQSPPDPRAEASHGRRDARKRTHKTA